MPQGSYKPRGGKQWKSTSSLIYFCKIHNSNLMVRRHQQDTKYFSILQNALLPKSKGKPRNVRIEWDKMTKAMYDPGLGLGTENEQ